jgi:hypothetical protein
MLIEQMCETETMMQVWELDRERQSWIRLFAACEARVRKQDRGWIAYVLLPSGGVATSPPLRCAAAMDWAEQRMQRAIADQRSIRPAPPASVPLQLPTLRLFAPVVQAASALFRTGARS